MHYFNTITVKNGLLFCPIREESSPKAKSKKPIKSVKSPTSLDSSPLKKSRRRVARVLEDSSDEENETMDTTPTSPVVNGHKSNENEKEINEKAESQENGKPQANGHCEDKKMSSPSSSNEENIPKRTTGVDAN